MVFLYELNSLDEFRQYVISIYQFSMCNILFIFRDFMHVGVLMTPDI